MHKPPLTVNGIEPDPTTRNLYLEQVPLADNLASDIAQINNGDFVIRTSGGDTSIEDGAASLVTIKGNMVKTGYVPEELTLTVTPATREEGVDPITATIDRDTFVAYVVASGTITLTYTTAWSADPANYGITVEGTPIAGDVITVVYVKEERGTITTATPTSFNSTGWNLYNNTDGYARVVAYSTQYGYRIGGTYSLVDFSTTLTGARTAVTVEDGLFNVAEDGYIFVTNGDATTFIYPTWTNWTDEYTGDFQTYTVDTIDLSEAMLLFPYGLLAVGNTRDEINLNVQRCVQRIERLAYTAENLETVIESGVDYDTDTNYIYAVLESPVSTAIIIDGGYTVSDHGIEFFTGTTVPVVTETLYGENLKDKLRTDVLTISEQTLTSTQKTQVQANLGLVIANDLTTTDAGKVLDARQGKLLNDKIATSALTLTASTGFSKRPSCRLEKAGNVVTLAFDIATTSAMTLTTTYKEVLSFDNNYSPTTDVFALCWVLGSSNILLVDIVSGKVSVRTFTSNVNLNQSDIIRGTVTWITGV
jgi:hypothetical protein